MICLLAAAKNFHQLFLENALIKKMYKIGTTKDNYINYKSVLQIALKTNVWISYKLRKSKSSNDVIVLLWIRRSKKTFTFFKLQSIPYK